MELLPSGASNDLPDHVEITSVQRGWAQEEWNERDSVIAVVRVHLRVIGSCILLGGGLGTHYYGAIST